MNSLECACLVSGYLHRLLSKTKEIADVILFVICRPKHRRKMLLDITPENSLQCACLVSGYLHRLQSKTKEIADVILFVI